MGNIGNTWLRIDEDRYEAEYEWLSTWEDIFGEGNEPLPEGYFSGQMTFGTGEGTGIAGENSLSPGGNREPADTDRELFGGDLGDTSLQRMVVCVPQFDTMHPSMTLGANFNDRDFACMSRQE
ncbi:MAG: hypothetical protein K2P59_02200 [Acetatifactor sp.]|nr:hypothetical protein [Acetatifactor sp.]